MNNLVDGTTGYSIGKDFNPGGLLVESLQVIIYALAIFIIVYLFFAIPNQVQGTSMYPTLKNGEILLTNKFIQIAGGEDHIFPNYDYQQGDIVVFQQPGEKDLVKRIIGMPGDKVKIRDGRVIVNGQVLIEKYITDGVLTNANSFLPDNVEKTVPYDSYFVLGDNRPKSQDSRTVQVGFVKRVHMKGSPFLRITPIDEFGLLGRGEITTTPEIEVFGL